MRNWWRNLPLVSRLTALSVGLLTALLGVLSSVLYFNLRRFLHTNTALRVRAQAKPVIERLLGPSQHNKLETLAADLSHALTSRDTTATIFDQQGKFLADGRRLPEEPIAMPFQLDKLSRALHGEKEITYTTSSGGQRAVISLIPLRRMPLSKDVLGVAQLTTPLTQIDQILSRQGKMLTIGVLITMGLGILGEFWLIRSSLDPLKRVIHTIRRIAGGDLSQRVQLPRTQDEVGQLASSVDQMAGNIESAFESQSRFVSAAAHELRTPLTALLGSLDVLQRGSQDDPVARRALLQGMHHEVTRLNRLTDQLLALTRLEAPEAINLEIINLTDCIDAVVQQVRFILGDREFKVIPGPAVQLNADPDLLTQVLFNLIDNAIQHTDPGGYIELRWMLAEQAVVVSVSDHGEGIAAEDLPHVFERFYRGDRSRSQRHGGTGLGLAIVQAIIQAHHGKIEVQSQTNRGTQFDILLPLQL
jgi:signal transduction histidine kinase